MGTLHTAINMRIYPGIVTGNSIWCKRLNQSRNSRSM